MNPAASWFCVLCAIFIVLVIRYRLKHPPSEGGDLPDARLLHLLRMKGYKGDVWERGITPHKQSVVPSPRRYRFHEIVE